MLTEFGKFSRKLRIDCGELLKNMADKLGVTPSYLSAVENGKRNVPEEWINVIIEKYNLENRQISELKQAYYDTLTDVNINMKGKNIEDRRLITSFARKFDTLDEKTKKELKNIFNVN